MLSHVMVCTYISHVRCFHHFVGFCSIFTNFETKFDTRSYTLSIAKLETAYKNAQNETCSFSPTTNPILTKLAHVGPQGFILTTSVISQYTALYLSFQEKNQSGNFSDILCISHFYSFCQFISLDKV